MDKACPVVLRHKNDQLEILVFRHPLAGIQLAKGSIEPGETYLEASARELREEAGLALNAQYQLLAWQRSPGEPTWSICMMEHRDDLPDDWEHYCEDDGGHLFRFFWHPLLQTPSLEWHPVFVDALDAIRTAIQRHADAMLKSGRGTSAS